MTLDEIDRHISRLAANQQGLVSRAQLLHIGLTPRVLQHRLATHRFQPFLPTVYRLAGTPATYLQDLWGACLWLGDGTAVSHIAAAHLWGFDRFSSGRIEVSTLNRRHTHGACLLNGSPIVAHRRDERLISEIVEVKGLPITSVRRTILDLCGGKDLRAERMLDAAIRRDLTTLADLWLFLDQEWMRGRRGVRILRNYLADRTPGIAPNDSDLELDLRDALVAHGLPKPEHQYPVDLPGYTVHLDLAYPKAMLAIEVDSYSWHMDRAAFERDRERDNELSLLGWDVLRFTWAMIRYQLPRVVETVRARLRR